MFIVTLHGDLRDLKVNPSVVLLLCTSTPSSVPELYRACGGRGLGLLSLPAYSDSTGQKVHNSLSG